MGAEATAIQNYDSLLPAKSVVSVDYGPNTEPRSTDGRKWRPGT